MVQMTDKINSKGILIVTPFFSPNIGGVETHLDDLCTYLSQNDYRVFVVTYQPLTTRVKGLGLERRGNIEIHRCAWFGYGLFHKLNNRPFLNLLYLTPWLLLNSLFFMLKNHKRVDVIHAQGFNSALIGKILAKVFKKRLIISTHAIYSLQKDAFISKMIYWILSSADKVLAISNPSRKELIKIGLREEQVITYTYWVDQEVFKPLPQSSKRKEMGWQDKFVVLFVGRLIKIKGIEVLLEAARDFDDKVVFAFIGQGPLENLLTEESRLKNNVKFLGPVDNLRLVEYLNAVDVLAVPSVYEEGFGRVILEALSCGIPVIASKRGGIAEAINETVGVLIDINKANLQQAILNLYQNREHYLRLKNNAREYAVSHFNIENAGVITAAYQNS